MGGLIGLIQIIFTALGFLIVIRAFMSWVPSLTENELGRLVVQITDPILEPIRRFLPPIGGLDLSPMIAVLVIFSIVRVLNTLG